jgi:hypothetical protein
LLVLRRENRVLEHLDLDAGLAQNHYALASHPRVPIQHAHDDAGDAGPQDGLDARRRSTVVVARLKGDVDRGTTRRVPGVFEGADLGVVLACPGVPALAYNDAAARDHSPYEGIRRHRVTPALGKAAGEIHERIPYHLFLSPIRTLTVGAGIRAAVRLFTGSTAGLSPEARGLPEKTVLLGLTAGAGIAPAPES